MSPGNIPDRRFQVALGLSLLAHALLAGSWSGGVRGGAPPAPWLQARLESPFVVSQGAAPALEPGVAAIAGQSERLPFPARRSPAPVSAPGTGAAGTDSPFYPARELDRYPEPLELPWPQQVRAAAHVRVWVSIDDQGRVIDVVAAGSGQSVADIRERLLAVRFLPGRKDGRPVKSRLLMEWPESRATGTPGALE